MARAVDSLSGIVTVTSTTVLATNQTLPTAMIIGDTANGADYKLGSITHPDASVRRKAVAHLVECLGDLRRVQRQRHGDGSLRGERLEA